MGEMKSAWEIAMEKTEKLGKLSAEDIRKQEEKKFTKIGRVLAEEYLIKTDIRQLEIELNRYNPDERTLLRKSFIITLVEAMNLQDYETDERILYAVSLIGEDESIKEFIDETAEILEGYKQLEQEQRQIAAKGGEEALHQLGISGSAVKAFNPRADSEWQERLDKLAEPYEKKLIKCKQEFLSAV